MEVWMKLSATNRAVHRSGGLQERVFPLSQARRALRYLQPVLRDAVESYQQAQQARAALKLARSREERAGICKQRDEAIARLNRTIDECHAVGVCMIDIAQGLVGLTVRHEESQMCVIWRLGEPIDAPWQEVDAQAAAACGPCYAARLG